MASTLIEYGEAQDDEEVVRCVKEFKSSKLWLVARVALQQSMEPEEQIRRRNSALLVRLHQKGVCSNFDEGIRAFLLTLDEAAEDSPLAPKWAADMVADWVEEHCATLRCLTVSAPPDTPVSPHLEKFAGFLLSTLIRRLGLEAVRRLYAEAGVQETSFLHHTLQEFCNTYELSLLLIKG